MASLTERLILNWETLPRDALNLPTDLVFNTGITEAFFTMSRRHEGEPPAPKLSKIVAGFFLVSSIIKKIAEH